MAKIKTTLVDAIYINNSGGKVLLDYLVDEIEKNKINVFYLFDDRCKSSFGNIPDERKLFVKNSMVTRYKFYLKNRKQFHKVLCFANLPPFLRLKNVIVGTYFHNTLIVDPPKNYAFNKRVYVFIQKSIILFFKRNSNYWFVQSNNVKELISKRISIDKSKIKILPFYKLDASEGDNENRKPFTFIYPSTGSEHKNHKKLFQAWYKLHEMGYNPELNLTISEMDAELKEEFKKLKKAGVNVINHGHIPFEKLKKMYLKSEFLVYPSLSESFGLALIEAINFGCKVVASDLPYIHSVIQPSVVFNPTNVDSIVQAVEECLNEKTEKSVCLVENKIDDLIEFIK